MESGDERQKAFCMFSNSVVFSQSWTYWKNEKVQKRATKLVPYHAKVLHTGTRKDLESWVFLHIGKA